MTVTTKRDWKRTLRTIKSELSPELREAARRMKQAERGHGRTAPAYESARTIRHTLMRKEKPQ